MIGHSSEVPIIVGTIAGIALFFTIIVMWLVYRKRKKAKEIEQGDCLYVLCVFMTHLYLSFSDHEAINTWLTGLVRDVADHVELLIICCFSGYSSYHNILFSFIIIITINSICIHVDHVMP